MTREEATIQSLLCHIETLEETIKALEQEPCTDAVSREVVKEALRNRTGESISECINAIPSVNSQKWIPVSERLPEGSGDYIVSKKWFGKYSGDLYIESGVSYYAENLKCWDCDGVVAWMPLPEPYKAEMESEDGN